MIDEMNKECKVGDKAVFSKTVSESDIYLFAGVSGDYNPAHVNEAYAKKTSFHTRIAHGMLSASFISTVLGTKLPGPGTIYLEQSLVFKKPVFIGDTVTAEVEIIEIIKEKICRLQTNCKNQKNEVVLEGVATVMLPQDQ